MKNIKNTHIEGLYKINKSDNEKIYKTLIDAFRKYPKLMCAFPKERPRIAAIEATIRYYGAYDLHYGSAYSLNDQINEVAIIVHSDDMRYSLFRHILSGSYSKEYRAAINKLTKADREKRLRLFEEMDRLEAAIDIPRPHIYLDFLGVKESCQNQGRGRKLMSAITRFASSVGLPVMLFTNTSDHVSFYESLGFQTIGVTSSEEFGFTNTYLIYKP